MGMKQLRHGIEWRNIVTHTSMQSYIDLYGLIQYRGNPNPFILSNSTSPRILNKLQDLMSMLSPENYVR